MKTMLISKDIAVRGSLVIGIVAAVWGGARWVGARENHETWMVDSVARINARMDTAEAELRRHGIEIDRLQRPSGK